MPKLTEESLQALCRSFLLLKSEEECQSFFSDLCTYQELEALAQRLQVARSLMEGKSYLEINRETGVSTATIGRVSRALQYGSGGYRTVLERLYEK